MKRAIRLCIVIIFCSISTTKAQMSFIATNGENIKLKHASKKEENSIVLYLSSEEIPDSVERIGILSGNYKKRAKAFIAAKSFAAQAKGNAILFVDGNDMKGGEKALNALFGTNIKGNYNFYVYRNKLTKK